MANQIKIARFEVTIKEVISKAIITEVKNKVAKNATILEVKLAKDLSVAKVYVDCLDRTKINEVILNLNKLKGFFRTKIATALNIYKTPNIVFCNDETIDRSSRIEELLRQIKDDEKR